MMLAAPRPASTVQSLAAAKFRRTSTQSEMPLRARQDFESVEAALNKLWAKPMRVRGRAASLAITEARATISAARKR